ncbi:MAG: hypothetical protein IT514_00400 [Burkholderiales bacterium]|nr:hypothetical protein [Burkholderiales bacterium]
MAVALDLAAREAALAAFEAKKAGILDAIKHKRRRSQDTAKEEGELDVLEARKVLLSAELNRRMEELLHGDNRWLAGPASAVPSTISVGGGITREDEETEIQALNDWVESQGLSRGVVSYDFADPQSGEQRAVFDLAWPSGLREELSQPVAVLLNEDAATIRIAGEAGFRCFTETKSFMRCVKEGVPREAVPA